jgi:hypothetical protein
MTLFLLLACSPETPDSAVDTGPVLDPVAQAWVDAHNAARGRAEPTPEPALPDLTWDDGLAEVAATWAAGCVFEHSTTQYGENLAAFSASVESADVVDAWFSEIEFYDYATDSCEAGEMCGHYTQVVWRDTARVGCAVESCTLDGFGRGDFYVCNYDPAGNWVGEKPY